LVSDQPAALTQSCALVLGNARQASGHGALAGLVQGNDCSPHIQTDHKSLGDVEIRDASENKMANVRQLRSKAVLTSYK
jgi:hypothetical protein